MLPYISEFLTRTFVIMIPDRNKCFWTILCGSLCVALFLVQKLRFVKLFTETTIVIFS